MLYTHVYIVLSACNFDRARRGQQSYFFPIQLSEQVLPSSIFYGTFLPTVAYFAVKKLIIDPYVRRKESE